MSSTTAEDVEAALAGKEWIGVQKKTFTNWINDKLKETKYSVEEISRDLGDGVILIALLLNIAPGKKMPRKYKSNPRMDIQKRENLDIAFQFLSSVEKIHLVNIGANDIYQGNLKLILALIWALIHHYQIAGTASTEPVEDGLPAKSKNTKKKINAKKLLLDWVNATLPQDRITNFTTNWNDGLHLSSLVDYCKPGLIPNHASLNPENRFQNVSHAMDLAEKELGVPKLLSPEDLTADKPDELSVMTYISGFCRPNSAGQSSLLEWVNMKIPNQTVSNFTSDWVDGTVLASLVDAVSEGGFPESDLMKEHDKYKNCQEAMDAAKSLLGIDCSLSPEDFSENIMDQITRSTYITKFRHAKPLTSESLASHMKAVGPGITGDCIEKETTLVVRGQRIPKWAKIDTTIKGPNSLELLPVRFQSISSKATQFYYIPKLPGDYVVNVNLNGQPIPGSPFNLIHVLPSNVDGCTATGSGLKKARVGETAGFSVNCVQGGPGELQVDIESLNGNLETEIEESAEKNYSINFTPKECGDHFISVMWDKKNIPSSPFSCAVTDPKQCSVTGLSKACTGEPQTFTVKTDNAGPGELLVEVGGPSGLVHTGIKVVSKNVFNAIYVPKDTGPHHISVHYANDPIPGSPFTINVVAPTDASKCTLRNIPEGRLRVGKTYSFEIDATQAGSGEMTALAEGPTMPEPCSIKEYRDNLYALDFTPSEIGPLKMEVTYGGEKLPQCPLQFTSNDPTKVKVNCSAIESGAYLTNQHIKFVVSATYAGEGYLVASVRSTTCEKPVELKDQGGKSYLFSYSPRKGGSHAIVIKFDGEEVPGMPIRIFVDDSNPASKVVVTQPVANMMGSYLIETPYNYEVITTGAGHDFLEVTSTGSNTDLRPTIKIADDSNEQFTVVLTASEPDEYIVNMRWGGEHVPASPFKLLVEGKPKPDNVVCVGPLYTVGSHEPVTLEANAEKAGAGTLSATCRGNEVGEVPVDVVEQKSKLYKLLFSPPKNDIYSLNVLWQMSDVKDSPFKVNLIPPDATKCIIVGPEVPIDPTGPILLHVDASEAGNGKIAASVRGDKMGDADIMIEETKPNLFVLSFVPELMDFYTMEVLWGDNFVPGAPFWVSSSAAKADKVFICELPDAMLEVDQVHSICVDASAADKGVLTATCKGKKFGEIPITVCQRSLAKDKYDIRFLPNEPDAYVVNVLWSGLDIKGSPFNINLMPVDINMIKVIGPSMPQGPEGHVELMLQAVGSGKRKVTAACNGNSVGPVEVLITETSTDIFQLCFMPPMPDIFNFSVQYGVKKLKDSPFLINTLPANASLVKVKKPDSIDLSKPLVYNVDTTKAGSGSLIISCHGEKHESVELTTISRVTGYYDVSFTPRADLYTVTMEWGEREVPGSPFKVDLRPPIVDKVKVGELHVPDKLGGDNYVWVDLDCIDAGHGDIKAEAKGMAVGKMPVVADSLVEAKYRVKFMPKDPDIYTFGIAYGNQQVTGSPFKINLLAPNASEVNHTQTVLPELKGGPVAMFFDTTTAGRGKMTADITSKLNTKITKKVEKLTFTEYKVSFITDVPDIYDVNVKWNGDPVDRSPFKVDTRPPLHTELVECGRPVFTDINDPVNLSVNTSKAGPGKVTANCIDHDGSKVDVEVVRLTTPSGQYKVSFIPKTYGKYDLSVFFDGEDVQDSPFLVNITPVLESCEKVVLQNVEETFLIPEGFQVENTTHEEDQESASIPTLEIGAPFSVVVTLDNEQKTDTLAAYTHGDNTGPNKIVVTKTTTDNTFNMYFSPTVPDRYSIDIVHNEVPIMGSPYIINYILPIEEDSNQVAVFEEDLPIFKAPVSFGKSAVFRISTENAGSGSLNLTAKGPGKATVNVFDNKNGTYTCDLSSSIAGKYVINILWNNSHIKGSPYMLNFKSNDNKVNPKLNLARVNSRKIKVIGKHFDRNKVVVLEEDLPIFNAPVHFGEPAVFRLSTVGAGSGTLTFTAKGPEKATVNVLDNKDGTYTCGLTSNIAGKYLVDILWSDRHIEGSPYILHFKHKDKVDAGLNLENGSFRNDFPDVSNCVLVESFVTGQNTSERKSCYLVSTEGAGSGKLTSFVEQVSSTISVPVTIIPLPDCKYKVEFSPGEVQEYLLNIKYDNQHITGSPFKLMFGGDAADAAQCLVEGDGIEACVVGKEANFTVNTVKPNQGALLVIITSRNKIITPKMRGLGDTTTEVSYVADKDGEYNISIKWAQEDIPGSPFLVTCYNPSDPSRFTIKDPPSEVLQDSPLIFTIKSVSGRPNDRNIVVSAQSSQNSFIHGHVEDMEGDDSSYKCTLDLPDIGKYLIYARWNGSHIRNSPFKFKVITPPSPMNVRAYGPGLENGFIGQEGNFTIETENAGTGTLGVRVFGPKGSFKINIHQHPESKRILFARYDPTRVGEYKVFIALSEINIPGSPFIMKYTQQ